MVRSLESMSRSRNIDMGKDPEGIDGDNNDSELKSFKEHMREVSERKGKLDEALVEAGVMTWEESFNKRKKIYKGEYEELERSVKPKVDEAERKKDKDEWDQLVSVFSVDNKKAEEKQKEIANAREAVEASFRKGSELERQKAKIESIQDEGSEPTMRESAPESVPDFWVGDVETQNYDQFAAIWKNEKENSNKSGVNPETGLYEKGKTVFVGEELEKYNRKKEIFKKELSGEKLTMLEKINLGRDMSPMYEWGGQELKPDHCYRRINQEALNHYLETGFVDNDINLKTLERNGGGKIKGRKDMVDWYLGATTPRADYGDILIEAPAKEEYFVPVGVSMTKDPDVLHMHSSGIAEPIPMSEVKILGKNEVVEARNKNTHVAEENAQHEEAKAEAKVETEAKEKNAETFKGEYEQVIIFEGRKALSTLKDMYSKLNSATPEQIGRFRKLYAELSDVSKNTPTNSDDEHKKLTRLFDVRDAINQLHEEL